MSGARAALGRPGAGARTGGTLLICLALVGLLGLLSLAIGSRGLTLSEAWTGLIGHDQTVNSIVVWRLRMPRTILAIVVGACLSVAGVVMQALTRNPLAEPGILGVNAGASLAVVLSISLLRISDVHGYLWFAFAGAALAAVLVQLMARRSADAGPARLVLAGGGPGGGPPPPPPPPRGRDDLSTVIRRPGVLRPMALPVFNRAPIRHAVQDTCFPGSWYASA